MVAFKGHFDGRVIIPSGPVSLPRDRELLFQVEAPVPRGISGKDLLARVDSLALDQESVEQIAEAIKDCERIDGEW